MTGGEAPDGNRAAAPGSRIELALETGLFAGRWLLTPIYIGLLVAIGMVVVKFGQELVHGLPAVLDMTDAGFVMLVLNLVDLSLAGNLLLIVAFAGYENFVSKLHHEPTDQRPDWMGKVDFGGLKLKLMSSIVAISAIHLLRTFMDIHEVPKEDVAWQLAVHLGFVVSAVLLALMDWLSAATHAMAHKD